ncbi:DUF6199 family natural product biosynthesis protein [Paenibacillus aquistagni]|uniref:DUF6199 domain-containing protein n=1 Tax=Paenibacillus aquistagni TaxID=1852522 RepID=A0A1X7KS23_9BACL|nr:hypothetical protein SAMN06295960_2586 [Paenibacillus aquistagni]
MIFLFIILFLVSLLMAVKPSIIWYITESWKSNQATEPSGTYIILIRCASVLFALAAIGGISALLFLE